MTGGLFSPLKLRSTTLANRIIVSPMCQYSATDGSASGWHFAHLGGLAVGGAGLLMIEATAVTREGRITPGCLGLWCDENEAALKAVIDMLRVASPIQLGIQLSHAGRKASSARPWDGGQLIAPDQPGGWLPVGPSAVPHRLDEAPPHALSVSELSEIKAAFVDAARRAVRIGFDAIELHAAHGYLLHQFLSPVANRRDDEYGGSLENRMRFPVEVFQAVRDAVSQEIPVGVRISATDWLTELDLDSWTIDGSIALSTELKQIGCDWIDVSSGGISPLQKINVGPGYQVPFSRVIRQACEIVTFSVGMITRADQAEHIIQSGDADAVALARAMLYEPRWAWHAAEQLGATVAGPLQYWRALPAGTPHIFGDTVNGQR